MTEMPLSVIARAYSPDTLEIFKRIFLFNFFYTNLAFSCYNDIIK